MGAPFQHNQERIFQRIPLGAAENRMLQNMGHSRMVVRRSTKGIRNEVLLVGGVNAVYFGAGALMPKKETFGPVFIQGIGRECLESPVIEIRFHDDDPSESGLIAISETTGPFQPRKAPQQVTLKYPVRSSVLAIRRAMRPVGSVHENLLEHILRRQTSVERIVGNVFRGRHVGSGEVVAFSDVDDCVFVLILTDKLRYFAVRTGLSAGDEPPKPTAIRKKERPHRRRRSEHKEA